MKKTLTILLTFAITSFFTNCQKKQYAYVQQGKVENFTHVKKSKEINSTEKAIALQEIQEPTNLTASSSEEIAIASVLNTSNTVTEVEKEVEVMKSDVKKKVSNFSPNKIEQKTGKKLNLKQVLKLKALQKEIKKTNNPATAGGKSQIVALILAIALGALGVHRFYLGYINYGIIQLLTLGGCGVWALIDIINIATGKLGPKDGSYTERL